MGSWDSLEQGGRDRSDLGTELIYEIHKNIKLRRKKRNIRNKEVLNRQSQRGIINNLHFP